MVELTPLQMQVLERLFAAGFRPIAIPPYENTLCVKRGECAALLTPVENRGLRRLTPPAYMVGGNLGVKVRRAGHEVFVWKAEEVDATPERLNELTLFGRELDEILQQTSIQ